MIAACSLASLKQEFWYEDGVFEICANIVRKIEFAAYGNNGEDYKINLTIPPKQTELIPNEYKNFISSLISYLCVLCVFQCV